MNNFDKIKLIKGEGFSYKILPQNTIYVKYENGLLIDVELLQKVLDITLDSFKDEYFKSIVDFSNNTGNMTKEAKELVSNHDKIEKYKICEAIVSNSYSISVLIGLYIKLFKPSMPTKAFSSIKTCLEWVSTFEA